MEVARVFRGYPAVTKRKGRRPSLAKLYSDRFYNRCMMPMIRGGPAQATTPEQRAILEACVRSAETRLDELEREIAAREAEASHDVA